MAEPQNIMAVIQRGRLQYEAVLFAASFRHFNPDSKARLIFAMPVKGPKWPDDPTVVNPAVLTMLEELGVEIRPFEGEVFGADYPYGNKIEGLSVLPKGESFAFFDTDTLFMGSLDQVPFDFARPSASLKREGTWPEIELYGPGYAETWKSLYDKFDLDFESALDLSQPEEYWERYPYYNAGFFYGECAHTFGDLFLRFAREIRDDPPDALICQSLDPWLDQVALPLVIHALGGGKDALAPGYLDGSVTCHWRVMPLFFARESDAAVAALIEATAPNKIKKVLKEYEPFKRMIYQAKGQKVRALFDRTDLPIKEQKIRNKIKSANLWMR